MILAEEINTAIKTFYILFRHKHLLSSKITFRKRNKFQEDSLLSDSELLYIEEEASERTYMYGTDNDG